MAYLSKIRWTHSDRLERWLGRETVAEISHNMRDWYGPPIAVKGVPGATWAAKGGDFVGPIEGGGASNLMDYVAGRVARVWRNAALRNHITLHGFSSLSDLISEATTGGKAQDLFFTKTMPAAGTVGNSASGFNAGTLPAASGVGGTSGTGRACTSSTTGAMKFTNPSAPDTTHITTITAWSGTASYSMMLADRLWDMTYNHATTTTTAIDSANRPNRYNTAALAPGNFISGEITTSLSATAHNLTVTYVDQDGNTAEAAAAYAAPVSAGVGRTPLVAGNWFVPLNSPDLGVQYLTNIAQSTITSVTGVTSWWIAHPLAWVAFPVANQYAILDGINSAFNLTRVYDSACLFWYCPSAASASAVTVGGTVKIVSG